MAYNSQGPRRSKEFSQNNKNHQAFTITKTECAYLSNFLYENNLKL